MCSNDDYRLRNQDTPTVVTRCCIDQNMEYTLTCESTDDEGFDDSSTSRDGFIMIDSIKYCDVFSSQISHTFPGTFSLFYYKIKLKVEIESIAI